MAGKDIQFTVTETKKYLYKIVYKKIYYCCSSYCVQTVFAEEDSEIP